VVISYLLLQLNFLELFGKKYTGELKYFCILEVAILWKTSVKKTPTHHHEIAIRNTIPNGNE
tara:strand:- start:468 stop:653 length:186 start_codon:yes stop_codon:yes gene_type:complete